MKRAGKNTKFTLSAATKTQIRQVVSLIVVVLVIGGVIYVAAGGEYGKASFVARFTFNRQPDIRQKPVQFVDLRTLLKDTPVLNAQGQQLFATNCTPCHGEDGLGNGPTSAGLNPPPRNFHSPTRDFTNGTDIITLFHTVTNGVPGTAMASWSGVLSPTQRMAVVHYVQHWIPDPSKVTPKEIAALPQPSAPPSGPMPLPPLKPVPEGRRIPISLAMKLMAKKGPADPPLPPVADDARGALLYRTYCASCHLDNGQGGKPIEMLTPHPYVEVQAQSFRAPLLSAWVGNPRAFSRIVTHGLPGRMMPGFGTLTQADVSALYAHVRHLAGTPAGAKPGAKQ